MSTAVREPRAETSRPVRDRDTRMTRLRAGRLLIATVSVIAGVIIWEVAALVVHVPTLLASPVDTLSEFVRTLGSGTLWVNIGASLSRIFVGFALGGIIGAPLGIAMASFSWVRVVVQPYIQLFRFIPPIAILPLFIIWMGIGEISKYAVIAFATLFIVVINSMAGVVAVPPARIRAAQTLGFHRFDIVRRVVIPSAVPFVVTGLRLAMGNSFAVVVAAEMVSANSGLGYMILTAQAFFETAVAFVGLLSLSILGLLFDALFRLLTRLLLRRYGLHD
jgi:ABC-type nitrate/sulfonate/bicarbonate transport system, permease component